MSKKPESLDVQTVLADAAAKWNAPGAACGLWRDGETQFAATGVLNVETGDPVRRRSLFQIGSITKVLTTTLIMQLVDAGRVDLDAPIRDYLPDFRIADVEAIKKITIRHLLNHTSGLAGDLFTDTGIGADRLARFVDRCALLPLVHPVGKGFSYSNSAFNIAGRIVEVVTGVDFDTALDKMIFKPLNLEDALSRSGEVVGRSVAAGHNADPENEWRPVKLSTNYILPESGGPAGSTVVMSVDNMIAFAKTHLLDAQFEEEAAVLSRKSTSLMQRSTVDIPNPPRDIAAVGLGWWIIRGANGVELLGHDGTTIGQSAFLRIHAPSRTIAVLFVNGGAANDLMVDVFAKILDPITGFAASEPPYASRGKKFDASKYVGEYESVGGVTKIFVEDDQLKRSATWRIDDMVIAEPPSTLNYVSDGFFIYNKPPSQHPISVIFINADKDGRPAAVFSGLRLVNRIQ